VSEGGEPALLTRAALPLLAQVAPPVPVSGLFTYEVPEALADRVVPGVRAMVPFGARRLSAMVVAVARGEPPPGVALRPLQRLVDDEPLAGPDILRLGEWLAHHLGCSVGEALDAALPRAARLGRGGRRVEQVRLLVERGAVPGLVEELLAKREKQARALRILADRGGVLPSRELMNLAHVSRSPLESLARAKHVALERVLASIDPLGQPVERQPPLELSTEQHRAHARIVALLEGGWAVPPVEHRPILLHGVTGSGKTEVYLQVLDRVVRSGRQGIVLVPEISLTPQTVRRFRERFDRVAVLHSHLTDAERHDQWRAIRRGEADVVVGARSAVFAPVPRLGLVILDEEHETSFKQQNVPRYHAREVAIERARLTGALVLLGTATPSLEAWQRAREGRYEKLELHHRVAGGRTPEVRVVDLTVEERRKSFSFITDPLRAAMEDALARHGQVLLFLNRRGWAPVLLCRSCRTALRCPDCDVSMTLHRRVQRVLCHYCGHEEPPPAACPTCGQRLSPLGFGTEKVEQEVRAAFPSAHVARMDSDTMSGRGAHEQVLDAFGKGSVDVLVGTQMIAKGLDFPNALLVGVLCADSALFLPDYRAAERTFQLLAQVTGRTGRGPKGGRVVVQAYNPQHIAIRTGVAQDFEAFARHELEEREALGYPPFGRLLRVVVQGPDEKRVTARAAELGRVLREAVAASGRSPAATAAGEGPTGVPEAPEVLVLGPAPAPIPRINRQHRVHLVAKCGGDPAVEALLTALEGRTQPVRHVRVLVDVDPLSML
jgi:primosomal protein N' (replication factor Y)